MPHDSCTDSRVHGEDIRPSGLVRVAIRALSEHADNHINYQRGNDSLTEAFQDEFPA